MDADLFLAPDLPRRGWPLALWRAMRSGRWLGSLKVRLAIGGLVAVLAGMSITAWQLSALAERDLLQQAAQREDDEARRTAALISRRLGVLQQALAQVGGQLDPATLHDPDRLAAFLEQQPLLRSMFASVVVSDADGRMLAYADQAGLRDTHQSVADRAYFRRAVNERLRVVSEPIVGRLLNEPVIVLAQPLVQASGVWGVLAGTLRLASRDLLQDLAEPASGDSGTLVVVTDAQGRVIAHPQRTQLLQNLAEEPRLAQAYLQWVAFGRPQGGEPGSWASDGEVVATAAAAHAGWQVWRAVPQRQLLAPVRQARAQALRHALLLAAGMAALLAAFLAWQLQPLARLERRAAALLTGEASDDWPAGDGEIGRLSRTLRHVWAERTQMEAFNAQVLQKLGSVMAAAPVGLAFSRHQRFELVSAEFCHLLGRAEGELVGQLAQTIFASNEDYAALGPQVAQAFQRGDRYSGEWQLLRADGSRFWGLLRARPVAADDAAAGTIWSVNDVSEQVAARCQLEHAAHHDPLTGAVNRQGFEQALRALFNGQPGTRPASLVMLDLDHFKPINDTAGHAAGDAMLVAVTQAISSRVRSTDLVVRLGGDEFALLLPHCDHERALAVAEKVRQAIGDLALTWEAHTLRVGASLGVAELGAQHASAAQWLAQADAACYEAKRAGRGTVRSARGTLRVLAGGAS